MTAIQMAIAGTVAEVAAAELLGLEGIEGRYGISNDTIEKMADALPPAKSDNCPGDAPFERERPLIEIATWAPVRRGAASTTCPFLQQSCRSRRHPTPSR